MARWHEAQPKSAGVWRKWRRGVAMAIGEEMRLFAAAMKANNVGENNGMKMSALNIWRQTILCRIALSMAFISHQ